MIVLEVVVSRLLVFSFSTTDGLMRCLKVATSKYCNEQTKEFVVNMFRILLKPMLKEVDCDNGRYSESTVQIMLT